MAIAVCSLSQVTQSAETIFGYWSEVSEDEPVIQASFLPKDAKIRAKVAYSNSIWSNCVTALKGAERRPTFCCPIPTAVRSSLPCDPRQSCQNSWRSVIPRFGHLKEPRSMTLQRPYDWNSPSRGLTAQVVGAGNRWFIDPVKRPQP